MAQTSETSLGTTADSEDHRLSSNEVRKRLNIPERDYNSTQQINQYKLNNRDVSHIFTAAPPRYVSSYQPECVPEFSLLWISAIVQTLDAAFLEYLQLYD